MLIYLKAHESYVFTGASAGDIIRRIAADFQLKTGSLADTGYKIPLLVREDKECFDTVTYALSLTKVNTGRIFNFYDDAGALTLAEAERMLVPVVIGFGGLTTDFEYESEINSQTYNQIKLVRPNAATGKGDVYITRDSGTIARWGLLQLYKKVDESMNPAQITEQARVMLKSYNREMKKLSIESVGIPSLRAGNMIFVDIAGVTGAATIMIIDKLTHTFAKQSHTMSMEVRID